jgi:hypothetical protein
MKRKFEMAIVDITAYGARGTGGDDTAAIQAAIAACHANVEISTKPALISSRPDPNSVTEQMCKEAGI